MIGRSLQRSRERLAKAAAVAKIRRVPLRARMKLAKAVALRRTEGSDVVLDCRTGAIFLGRDTFDIDVRVLVEVLGDSFYDSDFRDAVVLDLGAHKGYYGARAALAGARSILSYEPETTNFAYLEKSAASFALSGIDWRVQRAAVGVGEGVAELVVSKESWSHSVTPGSDADRTRMRSERVSVIPIERVLLEAGELEGRRLIVKVNVEGAECEIVLRAAPEHWAIAHDVRMEVHSFARCSPEQLIDHLARAGLAVTRRTGRDPVYLQFTRKASSSG